MVLCWARGAGSLGGMITVRYSARGRLARIAASLDLASLRSYSRYVRSVIDPQNLGGGIASSIQSSSTNSQSSISMISPHRFDCASVILLPPFVAPRAPAPRVARPVLAPDLAAGAVDDERRVELGVERADLSRCQVRVAVWAGHAFTRAGFPMRTGATTMPSCPVMLDDVRECNIGTASRLRTCLMPCQSGVAVPGGRLYGT